MRSLLHAITAAFHEVRDRYKQHHNQGMVGRQDAGRQDMVGGEGKL